jgi:CubicO group peptidase (beta-lactamase class C family)
MIKSALLAVALLQGCAQLSPPAVSRAIKISTASTSLTLCTHAFVSGLDPDRAYRDEVRPAPGMGLVAWALRYQVDRERKEVQTTVLGGAQSRYVYREGLGCLPDYGRTVLTTWQRPAPEPGAIDPFPSLGGTTQVSTRDPEIAAAIDAAFEEPATGSPRRTQAVLVVHRGQLIAERYADDVGLQTPLQGHSLSKSLTHALIGRLVAQGRLDPEAPLNLPVWQTARDPRAKISANHLLAMQSGLPWDEYAGGWDESTRMWFAEPDPFAYSVSVPAVADPGTQWNYSNLGYAILSRVLTNTLTNTSGTPLEGSARAVLDFAHQELFARLGMKNTVLTFDATETALGANLFLASARDWARLGLLYLGEGRVGQQQLLSPDWVRQARTPTLDAGYGRGFWLNNTSAAHPLPGHWGLPGAPADAYFARGYLGQFIVIVPSADLVIVRLGISYRRGGDIETVGKLVGRVVQRLNK